MVNTSLYRYYMSVNNYNESKFDMDQDSFHAVTLYVERREIN